MNRVLLGCAVLAALCAAASAETRVAYFPVAPGTHPHDVAAAPDGFISVANDRVSILAENAEMGHDIDLEEARRELEEALAAGMETDADADEVRAAEARVRAAEQTS